MALVVDCNNVLHAAMPPSLAGLDEARLCRVLALGVAQRRFHKPVLVICDGMPRRGALAASPEPAVELRYSGRGVTADHVIGQFIAGYMAPHNLVVASSDREIQKAARRRGATTLTAEQFIHELTQIRQEELHPRPVERPRQASRPMDNDEVARWARELGVDPNAQVDPTEQPWWEEE